MTKIGKKRLLSVLLAVAMVVTFVPVLGMQTAYAEGETVINAFTLTTSSDFTTPQADTPITYPDIVSVATSDPAGIEADYKISYMWYDNENAEGYYQSIGDTGMFTPGVWTLTVFVEKPSNAYTIDTTNFEAGGSLNLVSFGGKGFYPGSLNDSFIGYVTDFTIEDSGTAPVWTESAITENSYTGAVYRRQLKAYGGEPISYSVSSGTLPDGITLSSDGLLTGTFSAEGTFTCTIDAVNEFGSASLPCTFTVSAAGNVIRSFTLQGISDFEEYYAGDPITYPDNVRVMTSVPPEIKDAYTINSSWYDNENAASYYQSSGNTGIFTPGDWSLSIFVERPSDDYTIDVTEFEPGGSLNQVSFGGRDFYAGSINESYIGYVTDFHVNKVRIPPEGNIMIYNGLEQTGVEPNEAVFSISGNTGTDAGTYFATVSLKDPARCTWSDGTTEDKTITWEIRPHTVFAPSGKTLTYNGKIQTGVAAGTEYNASGNTGTDVGFYTATLSLKDKDNYIWSDGTTTDKAVKWTIEAKKITPAVTLSTSTYTWNGKVKKPTVTVKDGSTKLTASDYTVTWPSDVTNAGTKTVKVTLKGNYSGSKSVTYTIKPKAITPTVTLSASSYTWDGKVKKPTVTVKDGSTKLAASDYTVTYKNNKNVGKASAVVTLKGNYSGEKTLSFVINPKGTSLSKVTKAKKAATVKWKKQSAKMSSSRITGYQIQLATNKKFTKNKKTVTVKGYSKTSKKVTKLKGGKKYYVRIRTYKTVSGTQYYSPWSKVKTVTTKK